MSGQALRSFSEMSDSFDEARKDDLFLAEETLTRCRNKIALLTKEEELEDILTDLRARVVDWKNHKLENFGKLLLYDPEVRILLPHSGKTVSIISVFGCRNPY